jgi:hypothetical protein
MKSSTWRAWRVLSVLGLLISVSVQQLHRLRARFDLSNDQILVMSPAQLQTLQWQVAHPGLDLHTEAIKFPTLNQLAAT